MAMDGYDLGAGLIGGLQQGLSSYISAQDKQKEREGADKDKLLQMNILKAEKGLIANPDGSLSIDPNFKKVQDAEALRTLTNKAMTEGRYVQKDDQGNVIATPLTAQQLTVDQDKHSDRNGERTSRTMQQTGQLLESSRGNPAAQQAEKDIYAGQKLKSLMNQSGGNLSPQQVQLAATEIAKIASGGVPSTHELQGLVPSTIPSSLASLAQYVSNKPTSAEAQEFMKQYNDYADSITNDAKGLIKDRYGRIIESRKRTLDPEDYKVLQEQYVNRFMNPAGDNPSGLINNKQPMSVEQKKARLAELQAKAAGKP